MIEQKNPYIGFFQRPWLTITVSDREGSQHELTLLADTGSPYDLILHPDVFARVAFSRTRQMDSNFGLMRSGWVQLFMPDFGLVELIRAYSNLDIGQSLREENPSFVGLVGLPVLRLGEYGGNARDFWFRYPLPNPLQP